LIGDKKMNKDRLLDVSQVAARLNVSRSTVYRLISEGKLPASKMGTVYCIRILASDVEKFLNRPMLS